jgi:fatty acid CoA ligase FadD22
MTTPNLTEDLAARCERFGWHALPALYTPDGVTSHGELHDLAARAAAVLARHGVLPGDRVLIALPDGVGWFVAFLACARLGATSVPVNPELPAADHLAMLADCGARRVITTGRLSDRFPGPDRLDVAELLAGAATAARSVAVRGDAPLYIHYTSGTTGLPKGVVHRQGNPAVYYRTIGAGCLDLEPDDITLSVSKLYFTYGFCNAFVFPLYSGSAVVLASERLTPPAAAELVARHRVTRLYAVPSWYARMVAEADPESFASVRAAVSGGERFGREPAERAERFLRAPVLNQLGATEIGCAATANSLAHNVPGTIGRAVPEFSVQVRDADGVPVGPGVEGELWVRGPVMMAGYLNRPDDTARVLAGNWLRTRDRVVANRDGTFTHRCRADDMEMVGGITMSPLEVEDLLTGHPAVREAAVAAVPDENGASTLRAYVVPRSGVREKELADELISLARQRLAAFKVPRSVRLVRELPRTSTGKLRRHVLRAGAAN